MPFGRFLGLVLFVVGLLLTVIGLLVRMRTGFMFSVFAAGPAIFLVGGALQLFPGSPLKQDGTPLNLRKFFAAAPTTHKAAWLVAVLLGAATAYTLIG